MDATAGLGPAVTELSSSEAAPLRSLNGSPPPLFDGAPAVSTDTVDVSRSITQSGSIDIEVDSLTHGITAVTAIAEQLEGSVVSLQSSQYAGTARSGFLSINVPASHFDAAFAKLSEVGTVLREQTATEDVTAQHVDLQARVEALSTSVERLNTLLGDAATTSDVLDIENMLAARQADLDGLQAQLTALEGRVAESNILVTLTEPSVLPGGGPQTFFEALQTGLASVGSFAATATVVLGVLLPWIVILAAVTAAVWLPLRKFRRRRNTHPTPTDSVANEQKHE